MTETTITNVTTGGRSGYGAVPLTVSVLNFDPTLGCDPATFQPCSDRALSTLKVVGDAFREIYPINKKLSPNQSPYYGFFLEDKLYGGQVRRQLAFSSPLLTDHGYVSNYRSNTLRRSTSQNRSLTRSSHGTSSASWKSPVSLSNSSGNSTRRSKSGCTARAPKRTTS
jgi:hypothetical protein